MPRTRMRRLLRLAPLALLGSLPGVAAAQQQAAGPAVVLPKPEDIEPGVDTSSLAASGTVPTGTAPPGARSGGAAAAPTTAVGPVPAGPAAARPGKPGAAGVKAGGAQDRLDLDTTQITGNRELPKVLYIVPWKRPDLGDLSGRPPNTLIEEVLAPIDRDVFQRENRYYDALKPDAPRAAGAPGRVTETADRPADPPRNAP